MPTAAPTRPPVCGDGPGVHAYDNGGDVHCLVVNNDTLVNVYPVVGGDRTCRRTDANSCPAGMDLWVPRDYEHAAAVHAAFGDAMTKLVGVYRPENGCGACTTTPMNSDDQRAWEALDPGNNVAFTSVAGDDEPWFMRSAWYNEPNGNYQADCWLTTTWREGWEEGVGFRLDDNQCNICSASYLCSTNQVERLRDEPTPAPTFALRVTVDWGGLWAPASNAAAAATAAAVVHFDASDGAAALAAGTAATFEWTGDHDVWRLDKDAFESCDFSNATFLGASSGVTVVGAAGDEAYYACGVGAHCAEGLPAPTPRPTPTPTRDPTPRPTPRPSPAPSPGPAPEPTAADGDVISIKWPPGDTYLEVEAGRTVRFESDPGREIMLMSSKTRFKKCSFKNAEAVSSVASTVDEVGDNAYFADADGCDDGEKLHIRWYLPEPSPAPVPAPACEDSASWFYKKPKNTCAKFVTKKAKNCKKKDSSKIKAMEACPETCGVCDL